MIALRKASARRPPKCHERDAAKIVSWQGLTAGQSNLPSKATIAHYNSYEIKILGKTPREDWKIIESKFRVHRGTHIGAGLVVLPREGKK